jgi:hypothetical protein
MPTNSSPWPKGSGAVVSVSHDIWQVRTRSSNSKVWSDWHDEPLPEPINVTDDIIGLRITTREATFDFRRI